MSSIYSSSRPFVGSNDRYHYVYRIVDHVNQMWYYGARSAKRWPDDKYLGSSNHLDDAMEIHGKNSFTKTPIRFFSKREDAIEFERTLIRPVLNSIKCYNRHCNGSYAAGEKHGMWGKKHSASRRKQIGMSQKGKTISKEMRSNISRKLTGTKRPP